MNTEDMNAPYSRMELIMIGAALVDVVIVIILLTYFFIPEKVRIAK